MFTYIIGILLVIIMKFRDEAEGAPPKVSRTDDNCRVIISEVLVNWSDGAQYVEFHQHCQRPKMGPKTLKALKDHRFILVTANPVQLILNADLGNPDLKYRDGEKYYLLGFSSKTSVSTLSSDAVTSVSSDRNTFPIVKGNIYGMILLRKRFANIKQLRMMRSSTPKAYQPLLIDSSMAAIIQENMIDFLPICASDTCAGSYDGFNSILSADVLKQLGERKLLAIAGRLSQNNCGWSASPFALSNYQLGIPTPGTANNCENVQIPSPSACSGQSSFLPPAPPIDIGNKYDRFQGLQDAVSPVRGYRQQTLKITRPLQMQVYKEGYTVPPSSEEAAECSKFLPDAGMLMNRDFIKVWMRFRKEQDVCRFFCASCDLFYKMGFRVDHNKVQRRKMITKAGILPISHCDTHRQIIEHLDDNIHKMSIMFLNDFQSSTEANFIDALNKYEQSEEKLYKPTMDMVTLVYTEILTDTAFSSHPIYVDSLKTIGVNLGHHQFHYKAAISITTAISTDFHSILLRNLMLLRNPFSLIVDASTDNANNHLLACIFQSLEENKPMTYLYRVITLKYGEDANGMFRAFKEAIEEDDLIVPGFEAFFKEFILGYASDGASVMVSEGQSFYSLLKQYESSEIILSKCMAHKLELAQQHAVRIDGEKALSVFESFDKKCNRLYTYYMSRGSKRWHHLQEVGKDLSMQVKRYKQYYDVRWASSHYGVVQTVLSNYYVLLPDLISTVIQKKAIASSQNQQAIDLYDLVSDATFPIYMHEFYDMLKVFKDLSLKLETSNTVLIGKYELLINTIERLEKLRQYPGVSLQTFLNSCKCLSICKPGTCTLSLYELCPEPSCNSYSHHRTPNSMPQLSQMRFDIYDRLIQEVKVYFDMNQLKSLDLFDLRKFDSITLKLRGNQEYLWTSFCEYIKYNSAKCENLQLEYKVLLQSVFSQDTYKGLIDTTLPVDFWGIALADDRLGFSVLVNKTLRRVMTIPFSSADCERVFSYMTRLKSRERSNLLPANLENIIRIKFNGPKDIKNFDSFYYARKFLQKHVRVDDFTKSGGRPANPARFRGLFDDSRYF